MNNIQNAIEGNHGYEINADEVPIAKELGLRVHTFYRHEDDETPTHYAATCKVVDDYHRSGGLWEYNS